MITRSNSHNPILFYTNSKSSTQCIWSHGYAYCAFQTSILVHFIQQISHQTAEIWILKPVDKVKKKN